MIKLNDILLEMSDFARKQLRRKRRFALINNGAETTGESNKKLSEMDRFSGHYHQDNGSMLFNMEISDVITSRNRHIRVVNDKFHFTSSDREKLNKMMKSAGEKNKTMPKEARKKIIEMFGRIVLSKGDIVIVRKELEIDKTTGIIFYMFDFSKPVKVTTSYAGNTLIHLFETNFYVGRVVTGSVNNHMYLYSPKKQLKISNIARVVLSEIGKEYRGQGYGSMLYDFVANSFDALYSDYTLYSGSLSMWTKHMRKKAKLFGVVLGDYNILVPISSGVELQPADYKTFKRFVAIFKNVPPKLIELQQFLSNTPIEEIYAEETVLDRDINVDDLVEKIEDSSTIRELMNTLENEYGFYFPSLKNKHTVAILLSRRATFVVKEVGDELDYMII